MLRRILCACFDVSLRQHPKTWEDLWSSSGKLSCESRDNSDIDIASYGAGSTANGTFSALPFFTESSGKLWRLTEVNIQSSKSDPISL